MNHKEIVTNWREFKIPGSFSRYHDIALETDFIITISGPRRAGKTFICFQMIEELMKKGISRENILYINFEDNKLIGADSNDLDKLLEAYKEFYTLNKHQHIYLFLDEIQTVKNWDAWARKIHDMDKNIKLILTGSSSKLLSKEISTALRGRVLNREIFPLSFKEIVSWKGLDYDLKTLSHSDNRIEIKKLFNDFINDGGYPAVTYQKMNREEILQSYYGSMIFKDIVERYKIEDIKKIRMLANLLLESTSRDISYNKLANRLKSIGMNMSKNTIIEYISYFEDAYVFFQNIKYEYSQGKQLGSIKKVYFIDNGMLNTVSFKFSKDSGRLLENLVFLELRRRNKKIFYNRDSYECDFIIQEKDRIIQAVQVAESLSSENEKREVGGVLEAMNKFKLKEGLIITLDEERAIEIEDKKISVIPAWKWLLGENDQ
ncbi:MAG: ATP-binding protein [Nanoarchaeota archaeon]|nr:ATP-binding protein [Nanoarchaeota archaeon]